MAFLRESKFQRLSSELKGRIITLHLDEEKNLSNAEIAIECGTTVSSSAFTIISIELSGTALSPLS